MHKPNAKIAAKRDELAAMMSAFQSAGGQVTKCQTAVAIGLKKTKYATRKRNPEWDKLLNKA